MEKICLYILFLSCFSLASVTAQDAPSMQILAGLNTSNFTFHKDFIDPVFTDQIPDRAHLGYSFGVLGELPLSRQQSLVFGLAATQINHYPKVDYGLWYGLVIESEPEHLYLGPSYFERLRFDLLEIPLRWQFYLTTKNKVRPFLGIGMTSSFILRGSERWKSLPEWRPLPSTDNSTLYEYEAHSTDFRHFRSSLQLNLGSSFAMNARWRVLVNVQSNLVEVRQAQNSMVTDWIPAYWETGYYFLSQFSANVGLQRNF